MADHREADRYRKLLEDWKPSGGSKLRGSPSPASSRQGFMPEPMLVRNKPQGSTAGGGPNPAGFRSAAAEIAMPAVGAAPEPEIAPARGMEKEFATAGAILILNDHTPVIYQRHVPEKDYHLILLLTPNGSVKLQGIVLEPNQVEEIGKLPPQYLAQVENGMVWDRDLIVFHCYRYEDARRIPALTGGAPAGGAATPAPAAQAVPPAAAAPASDEPLTQPNRRGQRLNIKFGTNSWIAIYWGNDAQGPVVAHNTHGKWSLMHLDLVRFANGLEIDPNVDEGLVAEIETALTES